jgi:hypothetical protein
VVVVKRVVAIQMEIQAAMKVLQVATPADLLMMIQLEMMAELRRHLL